MLYDAFQAHADWMWPLRTWARASIPMLDDPRWGSNVFAAACKVLTLGEVTHRRPAWNIDDVLVSGERVPVVEEVVAATPFATLLRFRKTGGPVQPKVLIVAPMSGHFATLLRDTVRTVLVDHDVHVTDWHNLRHVPPAAGVFGLDEYTAHVIDFLAAMGPDVHVIAVCQPTVSVLAAVAVMSEDDHPATPASMTLMAGPIDGRINPTEVNRLANSKPIAWFEKNLISQVPWRYAGGGRRVYPGFVQLSAFIGMNKDRHVDAFKSYHRHLIDHELDKADIVREFYEEYMAVFDLSADFYLETVRVVFQDYALARGEMRFRDRLVKPAAIRRTALLTIEGERDDICAVGQTMAAHDLASSLRPYMRRHYVQPNVGHYGVFSGRRWQKHIYPLVRDTIHVSR